MGQVRRSARGRPKAVFLLLACCTQEEDAGWWEERPGPEPASNVTGPNDVFLVRVCYVEKAQA